MRSGVYKIQNIVGQTYVDTREHSKELCCRPATLLEGKGLWEIRPLGSGYTIRRLGPGRHEQFCVVGSVPGVASVAPFPIAWRVERVQDERYPGCEYIRFFWVTTNNTWDLRDHGSEKDRTPVQVIDNRDSNPCRIWKLIPERLDDSNPTRQASPPLIGGSGPAPPYDGSPGSHRCTCSPNATELSNDEEWETTIVETTTTTTKTVARRRRDCARGE